MNIKGKKIGLKFKPFIVAEISANHGGSIDKVLKIVDAAAKAGVDAIKLQTYTADTITINSNKKNFIIKDHNSNLNGMIFNFKSLKPVGKFNFQFWFLK